ncbi:MAG: hypothetical protein LBL66_09410 [Clostridiales bacterium]|jgi:hypothetical protein|nr:hypothetical protein [Clostridiales bacterium]
MKSMKTKKLAALLTTLAMTLALLGTASPLAFADPALVIDPSFTLIAASSGDRAVIKEDGTVDLSVTPTAGFGFRANMSALGAVGLFDVKSFTTTFTIDVPVNVCTVFSLQTVPTGTLTAGNGVNFMIRNDGASGYAVAIYDSNANEPAYWAPGHFLAEGQNAVTIAFDYAAASNPVTFCGTALPGELISCAIIDSIYSDFSYKAYYSISSYYFSAPSKIRAGYTVNTINGKTPVAVYSGLLNSAVDAFEGAVNALSGSSAEEEILAVAALDIFGAEQPHGKLFAIVDTDGSVLTRVENVRAEYDGYYQVISYNAISAQIDAFADALNECDPNDETSVEEVIAAYEAIDRAGIELLKAEFKNALNTELHGLTAGDAFKSVIKTKTEKYAASYEAMLVVGDAASLATYRNVYAVVQNWAAYKAQNYIDEVLTAQDVAAFDARIAAISAKLSLSAYAGMWTEDGTWDAIKTDKGLWASGEGKYYETLGFNQKLEVGKNAKITFNVMYALRTLGANHLHIGFYPVTETGTKGGSDGVRADFWFSAAGVVEVKPVNGKTETDIFSGAYLSVPDAGLFDIDADEPDYSVGQYTVELLKEGNALILRVNGQEMDLTGLNADLYAQGCYMTVSAMSVPGADWNEILITRLGDKNYIGDSEDESGNNNNNNGNPDKTGCSDCSNAAGAVGFAATLLGAALFLKRR